jgi:predicted dehydrogenase
MTPHITQKKLKSAIIGLGQVGILFDQDEKRQKSGGIWTHFSAYQKLDTLYELVAVVDSDTSKFPYVKRRLPHVSCFSSIEEMLYNVQVDVASICTPDAMHLKCLSDLIGKVKGVFLEKPICGDNEMDHLLQIEKNIRKEKLSVRVNYYKTQEPLFREAMGYLEGDDLQHISMKYSGPFDAVGSHALNLLVYLTPTLNLTKAFRIHHQEGDGISALFAFQNNRIAELIYCGKRHNLIFELDILGSSRRVQLERNFASLKMSDYQPSHRYENYKEIQLNKERELYSNTDRFVAFLKEIAEEITCDRANYDNLLESVSTQKLMDLLSKESYA